MVFLGVDPGVSGGLAALTETGHVVMAVKMPETEADILQAIRDSLANRAALERVSGGLHGAKAGRMGVTSAFTFGRGYGTLRTALVACGVPFDEVLPAKWQATMQCRTGGDKNVSKRRAQELFPSVRVTHAVADALLIAEWARRQERGQ